MHLIFVTRSCHMCNISSTQKKKKKKKKEEELIFVFGVCYHVETEKIILQTYF